MPETIAEKRKTIGMRGVDHQGFALTDPKMNPTYPCRRKADGMPMIVMKCPTLSSILQRLLADVVDAERQRLVELSLAARRLDRAVRTISFR